MYLGAWLFIVGFALFYRSAGSALYALAFIAVMHTFVVLYEEPTLRQTSDTTTTRIFTGPGGGGPSARYDAE